jgi:cell division septum initiation protein DivIVA
MISDLRAALDAAKALVRRRYTVPVELSDLIAAVEAVLNTPLTPTLSDRIRPNSEAAPWVVEEVRALEDMVRLAQQHEQEMSYWEEHFRRRAAEAEAASTRLRVECDRLRMLLNPNEDVS